MERLAPDSEILWSFEFSNEEHLQHHDFEVLPNGNILLIAWERRSTAQAIAAGRDPASLGEQGMWPDFLVEIRPTLPQGGEIVWEWHAWDHLIQEADPDLPHFGKVAEHPERININFGGMDLRPQHIREEEEQLLIGLGYIGEEEEEAHPAPEPSRNRRDNGPEMRPDWLHTNAVAYNRERDLIALSIHHMSEIWVLDHSTTTEEAASSEGGQFGKGGDLLWRWGNPATYGLGGQKDQQLFSQHDVRWIPVGMPGAGDLTVFNNGQGRGAVPFSSVDQITPPWTVDEGFVRVAGLPFGPAAANWTYQAKRPREFFSGHISGAIRLADGNTLIASGEQGWMFEVNSEGERVWEYRIPKEHLGGAEGPRRRGPGWGRSPGERPGGPDGRPGNRPGARDGGPGGRPGADGGLWRAYRYADHDSAIQALLKSKS